MTCWINSGCGRVSLRNFTIHDLALRIYESPPLTDGKMVISVPTETGVSRSCLRRMFSPSTKMFTCVLSWPCSFTTRSRNPTCSCHNSSSASPTVVGEESTEISLRPLVKSARKPAMLIVTIQLSVVSEQPVSCWCSVLCTLYFVLCFELTTARCRFGPGSNFNYRSKYKAPSTKYKVRTTDNGQLTLRQYPFRDEPGMHVD